MRTEVRIAGFGGQGVIMAGVIIGKAASLFDNKNAVQTQSYGPEARGGASRTEVVIDDDEIALRTLLFQLSHDYTVITASSGQEAFEKMASRKPDAILLDVRMPGMDGITFFKKMKAIAEYREIPTIFQTGVADVEGFDETKIYAMLGDTAFIIGGKDLKVISFSAESGDLSVEGEIDSVEYKNSLSRKAGLFDRIFR